MLHKLIIAWRQLEITRDAPYTAVWLWSMHEVYYHVIGNASVSSVCKSFCSNPSQTYIYLYSKRPARHFVLDNIAQASFITRLKEHSCQIPWKVTTHNTVKHFVPLNYSASLIFIRAQCVVSECTSAFQDLSLKLYSLIIVNSVVTKQLVGMDLVSYVNLLQSGSNKAIHTSVPIWAKLLLLLLLFW